MPNRIAEGLADRILSRDAYLREVVQPRLDREQAPQKLGQVATQAQVSR